MADQLEEQKTKGKKKKKKKIIKKVKPKAKPAPQEPVSAEETDASEEKSAAQDVPEDVKKVAVAPPEPAVARAKDSKEEELSMGEQILRLLAARKKEQEQKEQVEGRKGEEIGEILDEEKRLTVQYEKLKQEHGLSHPATLDAALDLAYSWIGLYKLEPTDKILTEILPYCKALGEGGTHHIKCIQSTAFLRFKQHRFLDALTLFLDFRKLVGNSAELCENIGHTYNSLGLPVGAEKEFTESIRLMDQGLASPKALGNKGGVLLGLGVTKDRLGKTDEALTYMNQALEFYKSQFKGVEHSLIAKTLTSIGHVHEKTKQFPKAEAAYREAVRIFKYTCGDDTPLTANAMQCLGDAIVPQLQELEAKDAIKSFYEAESLYQQSLSLYCGFDTLNVYLAIIMELLNKLTELNTKHKAALKIPSEAGLIGLRSSFLPIARILKKATIEVEKQQLEKDGNIGAFFKVASESCMLAQEYTQALKLLQDAKVIFEVEKVKELEKAKTSGKPPSNMIQQFDQLIDSCVPMIAFVQGQIKQNIG